MPHPQPFPGVLGHALVALGKEMKRETCQGAGGGTASRTQAGFPSNRKWAREMGPPQALEEGIDLEGQLMLVPVAAPGDA